MSEIKQTSCSVFQSLVIQQLKAELLFSQSLYRSVSGPAQSRLYSCDLYYYVKKKKRLGIALLGSYPRLTGALEIES